MTRKSRYFLGGSAVVLLVGLGGGLMAYYTYRRAAVVPPGLPAELRYVPADAALIAYADVHTVMGSDLRRELERVAVGARRGQQEMHEFAGIDVEKDVQHVVAYLRAEQTSGDAAVPQEPPRALVLARGVFKQPMVEQFLTEHGGAVQDYHGKHVIVRMMERRSIRGPGEPSPAPEAVSPPPVEEMALAFVEPGLIAVGPVNLVRRAIDLADAGGAANITANAELMDLMRAAASDTAWVVGRFDAVSRRVGLPAMVRQQVPPLRLVSASARIDGGVKATIKAQTADNAAADQLRDVVRGAISFARLQAGAKPELQDALKSIELVGTGTNVQLSFLVSPATIRAIIPQRPSPPTP